ncbi:putative exported protein [Enhygromyxa salina]|uniref:Putative exported protein n=1 Tax=Enhygromyxa salina TaxID=215803 RepID=A0A0C1ZFP0_9BACT|nr:DUF2169 domain-containing protein [Enhygromyxa salina]KIG16484.1 putative exported protein [Enhygromyxa salina]
MKLENKTPYPADLFRGVIRERRLFGSVAIRVAYDILGQELRIADEQTWPISPGPWESAFGPMPGDELMIRGGVDVLLHGYARTSHQRPVTRLDVEVAVGPGWRHRIAVIGDRSWERGLTGLRPSAPIPFSILPLTLERAYGGSGEWDSLEVPFVDNPRGRGFYIDEDSARGQPLPNIENPEALIDRWDDRPDPVGVQACDLVFGPRVRRSVGVDLERHVITELRSTLFNAAFPDMIAPAAHAGDEVRITGVRHDGPVLFRLPPPPLRLVLRFGEQEVVREPAIDQIGVDTEGMRAFLSYRFPFRYQMIPLQKRHIQLLVAEPSSAWASVPLATSYGEAQ